MGYQEIRGAFIRLFAKYQTEIRFILVGGLNTAVGLGMYPLLYFFFQPHHISYLKVLVISQSICITWAFLTNKFMVFRTSGSYIKEYGKFLAFHFAYFLLNIAVLPFLVEVINIHPVVAQSMFAVLVIISSYFWYSKVTFTSKN